MLNKAPTKADQKSSNRLYKAPEDYTKAKMTRQTHELLDKAPNTIVTQIATVVNNR